MEKKTTKIVELVIDENHEEITIDAISLVTEPAIAENFVYFNKEKHNLTLAKVDEEQKLLVSPALIPNKHIFRFDAETNQEYYVFFTESTVKKASEMYLKYNNNNNATVQHENKITGVHTVESWIVQDPEMDKSKLYGYDVPKGTWFVSMKIENDEIIKRIKDGELRGLSIEGYFTDKMAKMSKFAEVGQIDGMPVFDNIEEAEAVAKKMGCEGYHEHNLNGKTVYMPCTNHEIIEALHDILNSKKKSKLESYTDYPKGATENAKRGIRENEKRGNKCATQTGKIRGQQIAQRKPMTYSVIKRVYSYLSRAKTYNTGDFDDCGTISYALWGGDVMLRWAERKIRQIENE
tara:strand:- start:2745 stop:3791 length:1047 start_codon:yes stop_codon:yes gene_type:complete